MKLNDLPPGSLFVTRAGVLAVKSEYRYPNGAPECVLLASGEYAHFADGGRTEVEPVDLAALRAENARLRGALEEAMSEYESFTAGERGRLWPHEAELLHKWRAALEAQS